MGGIPETIMAVASVIGAGAAISAANKKPPKIPEPTVMPTTDDPAALAARRKQAAAQMTQTGRASTILSQDERLGG